MESSIAPRRRGPRELAPSLTPHAYRRACQRGIRTEDLVRQVERDIAAGRHFLVQPQFRRSIVIAGAVGGGLVFLLSRLVF